MINNRFNSKRTANGGFTLVELLVVIGIIAILAGVALGPITNGIKKAKQSSGMQTAHVLALAEFSFANDHDSNYPDSSNQAGNTASAAGCVIAPLVTGKYVSDPAIFVLSGSGATKVAIASVGTASDTNSSFDFVALGGPGLNSNTPDGMPLLWSTSSGTQVTPTMLQNVASGIDVAAFTPAGTLGAFGADGLAVAYKNNGSKFILAEGTTSKVLMVTLLVGQANVSILNGALK